MLKTLRWIYNLGYKQGWKDAEVAARQEEMFMRKIGRELADVGEEIAAIDEAMEKTS